MNLLVSLRHCPFDTFIGDGTNISVSETKRANVQNLKPGLKSNLVQLTVSHV